MKTPTLERDQKICEMYLNGQSSIVIGKEVNLTDTQVRKILRANGVEIRKVESDLSGKRYGRLVVLAFDPVKSSRKHKYWMCQCDCGNTVSFRRDNLNRNEVPSCGCHFSETSAARQFKHGHARKGNVTNEYSLYTAAKHRAKGEGLPFNLELSDIVIPTLCPILGIPLKQNVCTDGAKIAPNDFSPTLDKLIPELGYVKGNVSVISAKANRMKSDASYEEVLALANWMKDRLNAR